MKCNCCGENIKEHGIGCDWRQGRCPHRNPIINSHSFRFLNLINSIKQLFKREK
jgi:hypothetical protein